jgi:FHS family L-fucose permease-like MFS transporter
MGTKKSLITPGYTLTFILVSALFYLWALPNNLNDVLIPQFMKAFELNRLQAGLVQSAFYAGYFLLSYPAAKVMDRFGYKAGLLTGLLLFSIGSFLFYPASLVGIYGFFLFALFIIAAGLAFLETGANSFISVLGPSESSERRLNLAQSFNPLGAMTGVVAGTLFIFSGTEHSSEQIQIMQNEGTYQTYLQSEIARVGPTYLFIGAIVLLFFFLIWKAKFPELQHSSTTKDEVQQHGKASHLLKFPHFTKGVIAQFFYVGAQVGTWSFMIPYIKDYMQKSEKEAGTFLIVSLALFGLGRFISTALMKKIPASKLMAVYSVINILLVSVAIFFPGGIGGWSLIVTSFFMSLMFPTIFALAVKGLGSDTKLGGSFIIMAIVGGAVCTPVMGFIADKSSLALSMCVPIVAYIYICYYSLFGAKPSGPVVFDKEEKVVISH